MSGPPMIDQPASRIQHTELLVVLWVLAGVACVLCGVRIAIRLSLFHRVFVDDACVSLALAILLGNSVVITIMAPPMYEVILVSVGRAEATPAFMQRASLYLKLQFASTILFWSCLWAVKACFLAFFWKMTAGLRPQRAMLWVVVAITTLSYVGSVITYPVSCTSFVLGECQSELNVERSLISLRYSTAVDIITDILIIAIPVWLCWRVRISVKQRIGLYTVFCLGGIIMVFSVVRIIVTNTDGVHPEISWLAMWSSIESSVAVMVACLTSFKALLTHRSRNKTNSNSASRHYQKHAHGTDARSGGYAERVKPHCHSREEHELDDVRGLGTTMSNLAAVDAKQAAVSEESVELRQASFESQAHILWRH